MKDLFNDCSSLKRLPDISQWNISNTKDLSYIFNNCSSLVILPDISNWDTKKVEYAHNIIKGCNSLIEIPDFSKWNLSKIKEPKFKIMDDNKSTTEDISNLSSLHSRFFSSQPNENLSSPSSLNNPNLFDFNDKKFNNESYNDFYDNFYSY